MKWACLVVLLALVARPVAAQGRHDAPSSRDSAVSAAYVPVLKFDAKRDPAADLQAAIAEAQRTDKRIILDIGGDWCQWCHVLERFYAAHSDIATLRDSSFVTVAVYYGTDNKNQQFLSRYPKTEAIPHFFVLEKDGTLLYSQGILKLETGGVPDAEKVKAFLMRWASAGTDKSAP